MELRPLRGSQSRLLLLPFVIQEGTVSTNCSGGGVFQQCVCVCDSAVQKRLWELQASGGSEHRTLTSSSSSSPCRLDAAPFSSGSSSPRKHLDSVYRSYIATRSKQSQTRKQTATKTSSQWLQKGGYRSLMLSGKRLSPTNKTEICPRQRGRAERLLMNAVIKAGQKTKTL